MSICHRVNSLAHGNSSNFLKYLFVTESNFMFIHMLKPSAWPVCTVDCVSLRNLICCHSNNPVADLFADFDHLFTFYVFFLKCLFTSEIFTRKGKPQMSPRAISTFVMTIDALWCLQLTNDKLKKRWEYFHFQLVIFSIKQCSKRFKIL